MGLVSPCAQHKCKVHVSRACLKNSWMYLNSLSCGGQCSPSHLYGTISSCDSAPHSPDIISVHRSPTLHARYHPTSDPFHFHPCWPDLSTKFCGESCLPIMIGSSLPVAPLLSNPPARSILSTGNHPSHALVPPYSGCRAAVCSSSLH